MSCLATNNARILIVEDDNAYLERILKRLKRYEYSEPDTAKNETEARNCLEKNHYDIIITDMRLDANSEGGFIVVEEVVKRNITSIIIVLTANDSVTDCRKALRGGRCWDYISKTMTEGSSLEELNVSIQDALVYLNRWGNLKDKEWIENNLESLRNQYLNQYIAVMNNTIIEHADTQQQIEKRLDERRLPRFLPVIYKVELTSTPTHCISTQDLLKQNESLYLEFKSTLCFDIQKGTKNDELRHAVLKTIVAFLNAEGGILLIGVNDDKNIYGIENDFPHVQSKPEAQNCDGFERHLLDIIKSNIGNEFSQFIRIRFEQQQEKMICVVEVKKSSANAFLKDDFYLRVGNKTEKLTSKQMNEHLRLKTKA